MVILGAKLVSSSPNFLEIDAGFLLESVEYYYGLFTNDVIEFFPKIDPPPSRHRFFFYVQYKLYRVNHNIIDPPLGHDVIF